MDGNKEAAERCVEMAREALDFGDADKAVRLLLKSQRLYPMAEAVSLLREVQSRTSGARSSREHRDSAFPEQRERANGTADGPDSRASDGNTTSGLRNRTASSSQAPESSQATSEQVTLVTRVLRTRSYYEILEVSKECTDDDVKRAYRKLSLKVHPDKNKAKGAEEAFKLVSRAFKCLSDPDLRANYDRYGHEDPQQAIREQQQQRRQRAYREARAFSPFDDDFDPNDVFNAFFGVNQAQARMFRAHFEQQQQRAYRRAAEREQQGTPQGYMALLQLLPLVLFLALALIPSSEPVQKLQKTSTHTEEHVTRTNNIAYYVRPGRDFDGNYPPGSKKRHQIEYAVEVEYREHLEQRCYHEQMQQAQAYRWGQAHIARTMKMPNCEELRRLRKAVYV